MKPVINIFHRLANSVKTTDTNFAVPRGNRYGDTIVASLGSMQAAVEGSQFSCGNPTVGTALSLNAAATTSFNATAPSILLLNTGSLATDPDIILRRLRLICVSAGTALTSLDAAMVIDTATRFTSGGSSMTAYNSNTGTPNTTKATVYNASSAIVASAAGSGSRVVGRTKVRTGIPVVGDEYVFNFNADPIGDSGATSGASAQRMSTNMGNAVIAPGGSFLFYLWGAAQTAAPTYELVLEWIER